MHTQCMFIDERKPSDRSGSVSTMNAPTHFDVRPGEAQTWSRAQLLMHGLYHKLAPLPNALH